MARFSATVEGEDDEQPGANPQPWQQCWWNPFNGRSREETRVKISALVPYYGGNQAAVSEGYVGSEGSPDSSDDEVNFVGTRQEAYDDGSDSDNEVDLTNFWDRMRSSNTSAASGPNRDEGASSIGRVIRRRGGGGTSARRKSSRCGPQTESCEHFHWLCWPVLVFIVGYIVQRAPPPPTSHGGVVHNAWGEYFLFSGQLINSALQSFSRDSWYTIRGLASNVYIDAADLTKDLSRRWDLMRTPCSLIVPSHDPTMEELLRKHIVGQDGAMKSIARAIDAWEVPLLSEAGAVSPLAGCDREHPGCGKPLVLLLTGMEGVGKGETARLISRIVFRHCQTEEVKREGRSGVSSDGVLNLNGNDFFDPAALNDDEGTATQVSDEPIEYSTSQDQRRFREVIIDHVRRRRGAGAVIVLQHADVLPQSLIVELNRLTGQVGRSVPYEGNNGIRWDNVLFIVIARLEEKRILDPIFDYGGKTLVPQKDLEMSMRNEVEIVFGEGMRKVANAVAVFMPLELPEVEQIMRRKIKLLSELYSGEQWLRLDTTDAALRHFVSSPHVKYRDMYPITHDSDALPFFSFAKHGGNDLDTGTLMQTLKSSLRRLDHRPDEVAIFDYDSDTKEAKVMWCPNVEEETYASLDDEECKEGWSQSVEG